MARDAIARQYDVEKTTVTFTCDTDKGQYRPGTITFHAKKGRSIDLDTMRESLRATRLSGSTSMEVTSLLITASGQAAGGEKEVVLTINGSARKFVLAEAPDAKGGAGEGTAYRRLRERLDKGEQRVVVTGYVEGWKGRFPAALKALLEESQKSGVPRLLITDFQIEKE